MSAAPLTPELQRLHRLGWQPGAAMHDGWWPHLGLAAWRDSYRRHPACRAAIDQLIVARRGYPRAALPARLDERQRALLSVEPRIGALIVALGVIALDCADHLLVRQYRERLAARIGERGCAQLLALHRGWRSAARVAAPERIVDAATAAGARWWRRDAASCVVATLLASRLPPVGDAFDVRVARKARDAIDATTAPDMSIMPFASDTSDTSSAQQAPDPTIEPDASNIANARALPAARNAFDARRPPPAGAAPDKLLKLARFL
ncbi:type III secretion system domain-containing protein [Burkholderia oklahomensis]|uniref:type III secretion system domain-containing protein n=1 Tax=Burkholderia oklahomensis TaxID=342113 RepID=UPI00016A981B|nr:type III secretion system domain-containing protein [Burkholderia oklahomensis]AJX33885.1 type III secretion system subunit [Burkholderia oklahomensis C6786]AOI48895.1 hypothetical protein WI23_24080 [Burkholderia oklahomensis C6786]KUY50503.1 hypothetical protein WI23_27165 [Burkholderia oklahomensis C6786]MBI0362899.1 hypothetical protein [Burkholderia oklahomensis]SUY27002.1 Uncharacterised protein [Burkholderia oklahomensis]